MRDLTIPREIRVVDDWPMPSADPSASTTAQLLNVLSSRKGYVIAGVVVGLALAVLYLVFTPAEFHATADVLIDSRTSPAASRDSAQSTAPLEISEVESQVELIRSEKIAAQALTTVPADVQAELEREKPSLVARILRAVSTGKRTVLALFASADRPTVRDDPNQARLDALRARLAVRRVGASYEVEITAEAQSGKNAATVANAVATAYVHDQLDAKSQLWRGASDWLQQRMIELRGQANAAARVAQDFKADNQIIDTGSRGLVNEQQLQELNTALLESRAKTVETGSKLNQVEKVIASGSNAVATDTPDDVVTKLRQQYADLEQRRSELAAQFGPTHDAVRKTAADMLGVQISIQSELKRVVQGLRSNYEVASARQSSLEAAFKDLLDRSSVTNRARVRSRELDRTAEAYETLYTSLLQRYTDAVNQQSFPIATAQVISPAVPPEVPSAPRTSLTLLFGALVGVGLGVAGAFAREGTDASVRDPDQIERLGVPCFAMLPIIEHEPDFKRLLTASDAASAGLTSLSASRFKSEFLRHMPESQFAHAVQSMKTQIAVMGLTQDVKVIGLTSAMSGEGKSTIAANLSYLFAGPNRRTLLIDADIYNPTLSQQFAAARNVGLTDILAGNATLWEAVKSTTSEYLVFLPAGYGQNAGHADLLGSKRMSQLLDEARRSFDCVIVDLPPVGEIVSTREVLPHLDGLVLVATWQKTKVHALKETIRAFDFDRSKIVGVVLNRTSSSALGLRGAYAGYQARMRSRAEI